MVKAVEMGVGASLRLPQEKNLSTRIQHLEILHGNIRLFLSELSRAG